MKGTLGKRFLGRRPARRPGRWPGWAVVARVGVVLTTSLVGLAEPVPTTEIDEARRSLARARQAEAEIMAPGQMSAADVEWNSLLDALRAHGESVLTTRWIDSIRVRAQSTRRLASFAERTALAERAAMSRRLTDGRASAAANLETVRHAARSYPAGRLSADTLAAAAVLLARMDGAASRGNLPSAMRNLLRLQSTLAAVIANVAHIEDSLATEAQAWGLRMDGLHNRGVYPFVAVDKAARRLLVIHSQARVDTYRVDLGPAWLGTKRQEGDQRTPEGLYTVTKLLEGSRTLYHRALLLDYPTPGDRLLFEAGRKSGDLPADARIGGLIEIHGGGGRGVDWTDGCIALADSDIERLFPAVRPGMRVLVAPTLPNGNPTSPRSTAGQ